MVTLVNLRQLYGDVVETATIVRSLLAPVASQLSSDPSDLHRRCVFGYCLGFFSEPDDVHADVAPFGAVEAVAVCALMHNAAIVFRDESSVAVALRRQAETSVGLFSPVPPLHNNALPLRCMPPDLIKVALNPAAPPSATLRAPRPLRPSFAFRNYPGEPYVNAPSGAPGTSLFVASRRSRVYGPVVGADGHLWMDGDLFYNYDDDKSVRVGPAWKRVVRMDRPGTYAGGLPTFVPYVCYF
nr:unnamed protein product [Digitaria exilis]